MPISANSVVRLWSARALERLMIESPWMQVVDDRTGELAGRKSIEITDGKQSIRLNTRNSNDADFGARQTPDANAFRLNMDKSYDWNESVSWLDEQETAISLASEIDKWRMNRVVNQIAADIREVVEAARPRYTLDVPMNRITGAQAGEATLRNDEGAMRIVDGFLEMQEYADATGFPMAGRVAMVPPIVKSAIDRYLRDKGTDLQQGALAREAFVGMSPPVVHGWNVLVDPGVYADPDTAAQNVLKCQFIVRGRTVKFGKQIDVSRVIPDPTGPRSLFQGLLQYGTLVPASATAGAAEAYSDVANGTAYTEDLMEMQFDIAA